MQESFRQKLLIAIKKDDVSAFESLSSMTVPNYRFGRFPLLSVLYLYSAHAIISKYEDNLLKISSYTELGEPFEIASYFRSKAKKCLRLYLYEIVSPIEMLLILDKTLHLKRVFPKIKPSASVKQRLQVIYRIKYGLSIRYVNDEIFLDRRPMTAKEKRRFIYAFIISFVIISVSVGTPFIVNEFIPFIGVKQPASGTSNSENNESSVSDDENTNPNNPGEAESPSTEQKYYLVNDISEIDFASSNIYTLNSDVNFPADFNVENMACTIKGNNKTANISGNKPIFDKISGIIENLTFNYNSNLTVSESFAFITKVNLGTIDTITLNISGIITANKEVSDDELFIVSGIAVENSTEVTDFFLQRHGDIKNCTVNYSLNLVGNNEANASFAGIVGRNLGYIRNNTINGTITSNTFDISGISHYNGYLLSNNTNNAILTQTTSSDGWSPMVCGISNTNENNITYCTNNGEIISQSTNTLTDSEETENLPSSYACGITYLNKGILQNCTNSAKITSHSKNSSAYAGGISFSSEYSIIKCQNSGVITAQNTSVLTVASAGIVVNGYNSISQSLNSGNIKSLSSPKGTCYVGGITAFSYAKINTCSSSGSLSAEGGKCYIGGITGYASSRLSNSFLYLAYTQYCIASNKITIKGDSAFVGGVVGFVQERQYTINSEEKIMGTQYISNYFIGEIIHESTTIYAGGICGVSGKTIHDNNANDTYFSDNYFLNTSSLIAIGFVTDDETSFTIGSAVGTTKCSLEEIQNTTIYQQIVNSLSATSSNS